MWVLNSKGEKEFKGGKEDFNSARHAAESCAYFHTDDEDELVSEDPVSCYNCRYRRWTVNSFICMKHHK